MSCTPILRTWVKTQEQNHDAPAWLEVRETVRRVKNRFGEKGEIHVGKSHR